MTHLLDFLLNTAIVGLCATLVMDAWSWLRQPRRRPAASGWWCSPLARPALRHGRCARPSLRVRGR